jgi:hypothetical protein
MFKKILLFSLLACTLAFAACSDDKEDEAAGNPATATTAANTEPVATYVQGFYGLEGTTGGNTWRWMSPQGIVKLKNTGKDMKLRIAGDIPLSELKVAQTFKISLNGETLEDFTTKENVDKQYDIPAAKLGAGPTSELIIAADKSFVPKDINPKSGDDRKLSFSLRKITWEPK